MRELTLPFALLWELAVMAQYPSTRSVAVRGGEQRPHITRLAQGANGLLWAASDLGIIRSDGLRHDLVLRTEPSTVTAIAAGREVIYAALSDGTVVRCRGLMVDTLFHDTVLASTPVRHLLERNGTLWLGTYGAGIWWVDALRRTARPSGRIDNSKGMPDDHVNALCAIHDGHVAVATDQGIAICDAERVIEVISEDDGLPDNLVLSIAPDHEGALWAGTDQRGAFRVRPGGGGWNGLRSDPNWSSGPVRGLAFNSGMMWIGTEANGLLVHDTENGARYVPPGSDATIRVLDLLAAADGSVWWCDGSDVIRRCDPDVLVMPLHENIDLRKVSALCASEDGDIWFALGDRVFGHECAFGDADSLRVFPLPIGQSIITALHVDAEGAVWAGTLGRGVFRIDTRTGGSTRFAEPDGLTNDNVVAITHNGPEVVFGTLGGIAVRRAAGHLSVLPDPSTGFIYDAVTTGDGTHWFATDGSGVLRLDPGGVIRSITDKAGSHRTFYSVSADATGAVWASGPGSGLCLVHNDVLIPYAVGVPPLDGEVFAIESYRGRILAFGDRGVCAFDPQARTPVDITADLDLRGITMPLNAACVDTTGALWIACDRGLIRLRPGDHVLDARVPVTITDLRWGDASIPLTDVLKLRPDQNFLTFHFAGLRYGSPEELRFQYRLVPFDNGIKSTRDRDAGYSRLPPGDYRFEVRAAVGAAVPEAGWTSMTFTLLAPWYQRGWAIALWCVLGAGLFYVLIRLRDLRVRDRERMEKEKVRFQLEAVRSQVNPHFLFNSFNTLIDLIEEDRSKAVGHVQQLSDFFRNILQVREKDLIPLNEEMVLLDNYFALEQRRFGDRIGLVRDIRGDQSHLLLPPLTLQLLVENAIKHNTATADRPLVIRLAAADGILTVCNPLRPRTSPPKSTGFGLDSIRQRYAALTARPIVVSQAGGEFSVRIPLIEPEP